MVFSSLTFLFVFLPVVFISYYLVRNRSYRNYILLFFSLLFYSWGEPYYVILMIMSTFVAYLGGLFINAYGRRNDSFNKGFSLIITTSIMLGLLLYFKYSNFFVEILESIFHLNISHEPVGLPIGISFFTFQALSYVFDLYLGNCKVQRNYFSLLLYISLFPQLIAGPIVRYKTIEDQIQNRSESTDEIVEGLHRFIAGLSKKVLIANNVALITRTIYESHEAYYGTGIYWLAALSYAIQIYFDFSGYSDMAIGLGKMFGFHFEENFKYPYSAVNITDFGRRWHISLSTFFRDYVYIPMGGSRVSNGRLLLNLLVVWFLTGLWHGASWNFIAWGLYYGILMIVEKLFLNEILKKLPKLLGNIYTLIFVLVGWVIFESLDMTDLVFRLNQMFIYRATDWNRFLLNSSSLVFAFGALIMGSVLSFPVYEKLKNSIKLPLPLVNIISILFLLISIISILSSTYNPFIYFRF